VNYNAQDLSKIPVIDLFNKGNIFAMASTPTENSVRLPPPQSAPGVSPIDWLSDTQNRMARESFNEEHRPLLFRRRSDVYKDVELEMVRDEIEDHKQKVFKVEFVKILRMSGPVIFAYMLQNSLQTGSVLVVGRLVWTFKFAESDYRGRMSWLLRLSVIWLP
jgi:hypothetical protein